MPIPLSSALRRRLLRQARRCPPLLLLTASVAASVLLIQLGLTLLPEHGEHPPEREVLAVATPAPR